MRRLASLIFSLVLALLAIALPTGQAQAQGTGASIAVTVASQGQVVRDATVIIRNEGTGFTARAVTSAAGHVVFQQLPLGGPYTVSAERIGLRSESRPGYTVALGSRVAVAIELAPAAVQLGEIVVTAAEGSSASRAAVNTRIGAEDMQAIPARGRNFTDLAGLAPTMGAEFSLGGLRTTSTNIQIDGLQARNMLRGGELGRGPYTISMEAVREFEVVTNSYDVSEGRAGGGTIRAATQSGSNDLRASVFLFHRNEGLGAATDYLGRGRELRRLDLFQWGASVGGALIPDKLHFFVSGDRQDSAEPLWVADLRTQADELDAQVAADSVARLLGILRTRYGLGTEPQVGVFERDFVANTLFARLDWTLSGAHRLTLRHNYSSFDSPNSGVGDQIIALLESRSNAVSHDNQTLLSLRSTLGASAQNELKLGLSFADRELTPNTRIPRGFVRVRSRLPDGTTGDVRLQFGGNRLAPEESGERQIQLLNSTYLQRGSQTLTFGVDNSLTHLRTWIPTDQFGLYEFASLADLENGVATRYSRQVPINGAETRASQDVLDVGVFAQSEWRIGQGVTATAGFRWDVTSYLTGAAYNGRVDQALGLRTDNTPTDWNNLQPRAHVEWEIDPDQVLRAGAGAFAAQPHYYLQANNIFFSGTQLADLALTGAQVPRPDFARYRQDLTSVPGVPTGVTAPAYVNVMGESFSNPMLWKADVSYDRRLTGALSVSVSGLFSRTTDNYQYFDRNLRDEASFRLDNEEGRAVFVPATTITAAGATSVRNAVKFSEFTNVLELVSTGTATQKALVLQADFTPANGALRVAYTWNRAQDNSTFNCCIARTASLFTPVKSDPRDISGSRGPSDFDFRNKLVLYGELPTWKGVRLGARYVGSTGRPFSLVVNGDLNGDGYSGNDLAFVFDPDDPSTPADVAASMRRLLDNEQSVARDYIRESLGGIADRNGGYAPWVARVDVRLSAALPTFRSEAVELTVDVFNFANLLNSEWGGQQLLPQGISASNPISQQLALLNVVGFDQTTRRYRYTVNESVGVLRKRGDPYQIQLGLRYSFR